MRRGKRRLILPMLAPAAITYLVIFIFPGIQALYVSLNDWSGFTPTMTFVGLRNFQELLRDPKFWIAFRNTMAILFIGGALVFGIAFLFTILLSSGVRGKRFFRAVIFFPNVVAAVALATLWGFIYNPRIGLLNGLLRLVGLDALTRQWTSSDLVFPSMLVAIVWIYVGFYMVILLAGVDKIPKDHFDAAKVEGANNLQIFIRITIPMLWDILAIALVLWGIDALKMFELLYAMGSGAAPPVAIWTTAIYMYILSFGKRTTIFRMGYGTAIATTILISVVLLVVVVRRVMRREAVEY